jgi:hypothetical protein
LREVGRGVRVSRTSLDGVVSDIGVAIVLSGVVCFVAERERPQVIESRMPFWNTEGNGGGIESQQKPNERFLSHWIPQVLCVCP